MCHVPRRGLPSLRAFPSGPSPSALLRSRMGLRPSPPRSGGWGRATFRNSSLGGPPESSRKALTLHFRTRGPQPLFLSALGRFTRNYGTRRLQLSPSASPHGGRSRPPERAPASPWSERGHLPWGEGTSGREHLAERGVLAADLVRGFGLSPGHRATGPRCDHRAERTWLRRDIIVTTSRALQTHTAPARPRPRSPRPCNAGRNPQSDGSSATSSAKSRP